MQGWNLSEDLCRLTQKAIPIFVTLRLSVKCRGKQAYRDRLQERRDLLNILEIKQKVNDEGALQISASVMQEMGLSAGNEVYVAYLTEDGARSLYCELYLSPHPLDEPAPEPDIKIPSTLLEQANICVEDEIRIVCLDGAILIHRDSSFSLDEMNELLNSLGIAAKLTEGLDSDPQTAIEQLEKQIQLLQEGE